MINLYVPELFARARRLQNITLVDLAKQIGVTPSAIGNFEAGRSKLGAHTINAVAPLLNINPEYLSGENNNPFKSNELIKMLLPESIRDGIDLDIIYILAEANHVLQLDLLVAPMRIHQMVFGKTALENPVAALAIKDDKSNIIILRRKSNDPLFSERELQLKLKEITTSFDKKDIIVETDRIDKNLSTKIKNWTVIKEDIEPFFESKKYPMLVTENEARLLMMIRKKYIDPCKIMEDLALDQIRVSPITPVVLQGM